MTMRVNKRKVKIIKMITRITRETMRGIRANRMKVKISNILKMTKRIMEI